MQIGYIMEANSVDMLSASGPQQHVRAVIEGLIKRGHTVRLLAFQDRQLQWTDDLRIWNSAGDAMNMGVLFRFVEKPVRFLQHRLHLPFFRFFDSVRFSQACRSVFKDFDFLYERDGTMSYGGVIASLRLGIPILLERYMDDLLRTLVLEDRWALLQSMEWAHHGAFEMGWYTYGLFARFPVVAVERAS